MAAMGDTSSSAVAKLPVDEENDINQRLQWYHKSLDDKKRQIKLDTKRDAAPAAQDVPADGKIKGVKKKTSRLPIDVILLEIQEVLRCASRPLFVCERETRCACADAKQCVCDSDDYFPVLSSKSDVGSNCNFTVEFHFERDLKLSRKKNLRFFYLDEKHDDHEVPVVDVVRMSTGKVRDDDIADTHVRFFCASQAQPHIEFPLREGVTIGKQCVHFQFNYLAYV